MCTNSLNLDTLAWQKMNQLLPCVVQCVSTGHVLMQGYMDRASAEATLASGQVTFFSRSKNRLWRKGETSGNTLDLVELTADCDRDALLALVRPQGPTCHLGSTSCWQTQTPLATAPYTQLATLEQTIAARKQAAAPDTSYTAQLFAEGVQRCAQKVGEEGVEVALAGVVEDDAALLNESADLLYHLLVLLQARNLSLADVSKVLATRAQA
nr:bifunctional phosphoribosyl-AMP cyclohydrolase/phosphoribosyl-ATP diphosphatase HisIE [Aliidiomarina taiwanensis]